MAEIIDYLLLLFMAAAAIGLVFLRDLIGVVMLSGIYSLLAASLFIVLDAPDVALTEACTGGVLGMHEGTIGVALAAHEHLCVVGPGVVAVALPPGDESESVAALDLGFEV